MNATTPASNEASLGRKPKVSVISPCYNEAEAVPLFYAELRGILDTLPDYDFEILFVDDGSSDATLSELNRIAAQDPRVRVCSFSRNFGHQIALTAGLDFAVGDAVIMIDSDLQHPPSLIPEMVRRWREGNEIVSAIREDTEDATRFKKLSSRLFYALLNKMSNTQVPPGAADFCLVSERVCEVLRSMRERHRFLRGMISWSGFKRAFVGYRAPRRAAGHSKYSTVKMVTMALDAVVSFSAAPLRIATRIGFLIALVGFGYLAWNLIKGFLLGEMVPGWASLIGLTMMLGGSQLIFIGLLGQYLARVFEELKGRPMYVLKQPPTPPDRALSRREAPAEARPRTVAAP